MNSSSPMTAGKRDSAGNQRPWKAPALAALSLILTAAGLAQGQQISIIDEHPRLIFRVDGTPGARTFQTIRDLYNGNNPFHTEVQGWVDGGYYSNDPISEASRYVLTGDVSHALNALNLMSAGSLVYSGGSAENGIQWALAYDWIHDAWAKSGTPPANLQTKLAGIEAQLATFASNALADLDTSGPSLWHGRAAIGAAAWVTSLALPTGNATYDGYRTRAFNDWQESLKATHASGGWPEGPTYWATSRAVNFPLAYQAYQTAVTSAPALAVSDPLGDLRTLGLWQVYTERGDGSFDRYGDIASQVLISNGTIGRSLDYYAQITQDPALAAFAEHARPYRRPRLYDASYGWMYPISYDPNIPKPAGYDPAHPEACLTAALPRAMLFGRDSLGFAAIRQGWNPGDTEITFKAGDYLAHHGHCDQGTFTMFKYAPLVINSGGYGDYTGDNRLNYYVRTVAVNSILVQRPDETWNAPIPRPPGGFVNDGGQRIIDASGSAVLSYDDWLAGKTSGRNYEQADITAFANVDGRYSYVGSDLTRAYNSTLYDSQGQGGKVSSVTRQVVYLQSADSLVVFDRVASTNAGYKKKWLLHTPNKFDGGAEVVACGTDTNGIIEVDGATIANNTMTMTNGPGRLFLQVLSPRSYTVNKVGGIDYRFYVEDDGNDANGYNGTNHSAGYTPASYDDAGNWRIELSPKNPSLFDTFLTVLSPRPIATTSVDRASLLLDTPQATVMQLGAEIVGFGTQGPVSGNLSYRLTAGGTFNHLMVDLVPNQTYTVFDGTGLRSVSTNDAGAIAFTETAAGAHDITFSSLSGPATLLWKGAADNRWGAAQGGNWSWNGATWAYRDGDHVVFDDTGAGPQPVAVTGAVSPASVLVSNNTATVELGGAGSITGPCRLTKAGGGTLVLSASNAYTGGTAVSGGTVLVNNTTGSGTGTGDVTVAAATLGGTGMINGPVTLLGDATLTSSGTLTLNNTLTVQGLANQLSSGTVFVAGDVTVDSGGVFIINGMLGGNTGSLVVRGTLMGKGTIDKPLVIMPGGVISPGAPSTVKTLAQVLSAATPQTFSFEIGAPTPDYAKPANSTNDVIRLASETLPFANASGDAPAALTANDVIDVYFLFGDPPAGQYEAAFFAPSDYTNAVGDATFRYWRLDLRGQRFHNGNLFSPLDASWVTWSIMPDTAVFPDGEASGYITAFTVAPEPATLAMLVLGGMALISHRRK